MGKRTHSNWLKMAVDKRKLRTVIIQQCCLVVLISSFVSGVNFGLISPIGKKTGLIRTSNSV